MVIYYKQPQNCWTIVVVFKLTLKTTDIASFKKSLLSTNHESGTVLGTRDTVRRKQIKIPALDACFQMFTTALFTTARTWRQYKCPSTEGWIKKIQYIYTMEYYSALKKEERMSLAVPWRDLEIIIPSEVSQTKTSIMWYH